MLSNHFMYSASQAASISSIAPPLTRNLNEPWCTANRSFNTTYNGEKDVPPYYGIMFEMSALSDIEIQTFELDIRWDMEPSDLSVEVYTLLGSYTDRFNQSSAWELLAATNIVLAPEGNSGIIPASDFTPVQIAALDRRSFYVTMKGPYLDHTVYGLQKTGDIHIRGDDMHLFVGSGFTSDNFPDTIDPVLDPQFAGVVHYKKTFSCHDNQASTTRVRYNLLLETNVVDESLTLRINAALDKAIDQILVSNEVLSNLANSFGLRKQSGTTTFAEAYKGQCPDNWIECPNAVLNTDVIFSHMNSLSSSDVQFEAYSAVIVSTMLDALRNDLPEHRRLISLGIESASVQYNVTLVGVPVGDAIDDVQIRYFEDRTTYFLDKFTKNIAIFSAEVEKHVSRTYIPQNMRQLVENGTSSIEFFGTIRGAYPVGMTAVNFSDAIKTTFHRDSYIYLSLIQQDAARPNEININNRIEFFQGVQEITSHVIMLSDTGVGNTEVSNSAEFNKAALIFGIVGVCVACGICCLFWFIYKEFKRRKHIAEYRETRREERRLRKLARFKQNMSDVSLDVTISTVDSKVFTESSNENAIDIDTGTDITDCLSPNYPLDISRNFIHDRSESKKNLPSNNDSLVATIENLTEDLHNNFKYLAGPIVLDTDLEKDRNGGGKSINFQTNLLDKAIAVFSSTSTFNSGCNDSSNPTIRNKIHHLEDRPKTNQESDPEYSRNVTSLARKPESMSGSANIQNESIAPSASTLRYTQSHDHASEVQSKSDLICQDGMVQNVSKSNVPLSRSESCRLDPYNVQRQFHVPTINSESGSTTNSCNVIRQDRKPISRSRSECDNKYQQNTQPPICKPIVRSVSISRPNQIQNHGPILRSESNNINRDDNVQDVSGRNGPLSRSDSCRLDPYNVQRQFHVPTINSESGSTTNSCNVIRQDHKPIPRSRSECDNKHQQNTQPPICKPIVRSVSISRPNQIQNHGPILRSEPNNISCHDKVQNGSGSNVPLSRSDSCRLDPNNAQRRFHAPIIRNESYRNSMQGDMNHEPKPISRSRSESDHNFQQRIQSPLHKTIVRPVSISRPVQNRYLGPALRIDPNHNNFEDMVQNRRVSRVPISRSETCPIDQHYVQRQFHATIIRNETNRHSMQGVVNQNRKPLSRSRSFADQNDIVYNVQNPSLKRIVRQVIRSESDRTNDEHVVQNQFRTPAVVRSRSEYRPPISRLESI